MKFKKQYYIIGAHFLPALINCDTSELEDDEEHDLDQFIQEETKDKPVHHWTSDDSEAEFNRCEVSGLMSDSVLVYLVYEDTTTKGATA